MDLKEIVIIAIFAYFCFLAYLIERKAAEEQEIISKTFKNFEIQIEASSKIIELYEKAFDQLKKDLMKLRFPNTSVECEN